MATNAVGSINREIPPGSLMVIDDFLDFTSGRASTFYDGGNTGHAAHGDEHALLPDAYGGSSWNGRPGPMWPSAP